MKENGKHNTWHHSNQRDYDCMQYLIGNDRQMPLVKHTEQNQKIRIEIPCVPYFLFGKSLERVEDCHADAFANSLVQRLTDELGVELFRPPTEWMVTGMDIKHDFALGELLPDYLRTLSRVQIKRYKTIPIVNEEVAWRNKSGREIKFYDKHRQCIDKKKSLEDLEMSKGIGRFEVAISPSDVRRDYGLQVVTLADVFKSSVTEHFVNKFLGLLDMDSLMISTERDILEALKAHYTPTMARKLVEYLRAIESGAHQDYPSRTSARYNAQLKNAGVAPVLATKKLPPLIPNGPIAEVITVEARPKIFSLPTEHVESKVKAPPVLRGALDSAYVTLDGYFTQSTPLAGISTHSISRAALQFKNEAI